MSLSVALITLNEEKNIVECLESVKWADEIVIVDSGSTDKTLELAKTYTRNISHHSFSNFAEQKNVALRGVTQDWVFFIDADERVTPDLEKEIRAVVANPNDHAVYKVPRRTYFFNRPLRFSGTQDDAPIRLFPRGKVRFEQPVHEHIVTDLPVKKMRAPLVHLTTRNMDEYQKKLTQYVALEVATMAQKKRNVSLGDVFFRPAAKFCLLYFLKLGVLDGIAGIRFAMLSAYYDFLRYAEYLKKMRSLS